MFRPNVAIDPGLRLDDRTAAGLVDQMLAALDYDLDRAEEFFARHRYTHEVVPLGNPKGQARFVKQYVRALGKCMVGEPEVAYGKRKRFSLFFHTFNVIRNKQTGRQWLTLDMISFVGEGVSKDIEHHSSPLLLISHHALVRMVQRAACKTPEDLLEVLNRSMAMVVYATLASQGYAHLPEPDEAGWLIPFFPIGCVSGKTDEVNYLVLHKGSHEGQTFDVPLISTVLDGSMIIDHGALYPLIGLCGSAGDIPYDRDAWRAAFEMSRRATRRGRREL
jgi:hypothetical protein